MRIAVANLKGGAGKTTSAMYLSGCLAERAPTLLVDADRQGSALGWERQVRLAERALPFSVISLAVQDLDAHLDEHTAGFDHVVIDTPPGDEGVVRGALAAADHVIVPIPATAIDLNRLRPTTQLVATAASEAFVSILLTRVRRNTRSAREIRGLLSELGLPILDAEIPLREAYAQAFGTVPSTKTEYADVLGELAAVAVA